MADMLSIRFATDAELAWLSSENDYLTASVVQRKIEHQEYIVAIEAEKIVGYIRFSYFWSFIPYMDIIYVDEAYRLRGIGKGLLSFLEDVAREQGQHLIMSSSQADEAEPQAWHRHMGFRDAGALVDLRPLQNVTEVVFTKTLQ